MSNLIRLIELITLAMFWENFTNFNRSDAPEMLQNGLKTTQNCLKIAQNQQKILFFSRPSAENPTKNKGGILNKGMGN